MKFHSISFQVSSGNNSFGGTTIKSLRDNQLARKEDYLHICTYPSEHRDILGTCFSIRCKQTSKKNLYEKYNANFPADSTFSILQEFFKKTIR